ncbi:hypothetical protein F5Y18DRAFT_431996 [Xylariaceae sp. FL1019]|nr:hypothetical protein F5Y18DRAFT_431996 [Xylariaceae sp. FL1019]
MPGNQIHLLCKRDNSGPLLTEAARKDPWESYGRPKNMAVASFPVLSLDVDLFRASIILTAPLCSPIQRFSCFSKHSQLLTSNDFTTGIMPNQQSSPASNGSNNATSGSKAPTTYRLAKDAGFENVRHAGHAYGLKMDGNPEAYEEAGDILRALARHDAADSTGGQNGKK